MDTQQARATNRLLDEQFDALKAGVRKLVERISTNPDARAEDEPERGLARSFAGKMAGVVSSHPIAAAMLALGIGYVAVRIARR